MSQLFGKFVCKLYTAQVRLSLLGNGTCQVHTTPVASRDWGNFRQRLLMDFGRIINKHAVQFAYPTQVCYQKAFVRRHCSTGSNLC